MFVFFNVILLSFKEFMIKSGFDVNFILVANIILFGITILGFVIVSGQASSSNIHAFMRGVYTSFLLKMFAIITALFIFISLFKNVNKPAILTSMGLYIIYSATEVFQLMKIVREKKNE